MSFWKGLGVLAGMAVLAITVALMGVVALGGLVGLLDTTPTPSDGDPPDEEPPTDADPGGHWLTDASVGDSGSARATTAAEGGEGLLAVDVAGVDCDGGSVDDLQAAVDQAADEGVTLVIPEGAQCRVDETLEVPSGVRIEAGGAVIEGLSGEFRPRPDRESLVDVLGVSDVSINGGVWRMAEDEGANVFEIRESSEVTLSWLTATGAREDGIYLGRPANTGVTIEGVLAYRNGRSGISITTGRDITVLDTHAHHNGHVLDMRGLAIEPTSDGGPLTGIRIVNLETSGNARSGAAVSLDNLDEDSEDIDIVFDGYRSVGEPIGLRVSKGMAGGSLRIVDARFLRTEGAAVELEDRWASAFQVEVVRPVIREWGTRPTGRPSHDSAIALYTSDDEVEEPLGGVRIVEPTITAHPDAGDQAYYLYVGDDRDDSAWVERTELLNPLLLRHGRGLSLEGDVDVGTGSSEDGPPQAQVDLPDD